MDNIRIIEVKQSIFEDNDKDAALLREELRGKGTFLINLMSSPGAGKTTLLSRVLNILKDRYSIAVMEADIDSDVDAVTIARETGVKAIQLHTGGMCHLDADMTRQGICELAEETGGEHFDLIVLENVGNLVCPAEFDTGASMNMVILSVPEGDDKPLKYPLMFTVCDLVVINKIDVLPYFNFDADRCRGYVARRNADAKVMEVCALDGTGVEAFAGEIAARIEAWRK